MRSKLVMAAASVALLGAPRAADAFCGFYVGGAGAKMFNNATQVVLMREGTRTVLSMQNNYQGPPENFAMVVPVPVVLQKDMVKILPDAVFARVDKLAAPRLVEYWEQDPCHKPRHRRYRKSAGKRKDRAMAKPDADASDELGVTIEAKFDVGEYKIVILSAKDSAGLETWLRREKYAIPAAAQKLLAPYVKSGMKFFVAKVDVKKVSFDQRGQVTLSPLRFHYDSQEFSLPIRLGLANAKGKQDLIIHILAKNKRYEVANYKNVTIPTNLDVKESAQKRFGEFYAALFDRTLERNPGAVVTEYSWDASSCDPCPSPALRPNELATLGLDVLYAPAQTQKSKPAAPTPASKKVDDMLANPRMRRPPRRRWRRRMGFVLTRLHARYGADSVKHDLVFREAPAIAGGRESRRGGKLEEGASKSHRNNFQARYAIRHPWSGPIECANPIRNRWGGPPSGGRPRPTPALDLAFAPRGKLKLARVVNQDVPAIAVRAVGEWSPTPKTVVAAKKERKVSKRGCDAGGGAGGLALMLAAVAFVLGRRRAC